MPRSLRPGRIQALAAALGLLAGVSLLPVASAQAGMVIFDPDDSTKAIGILNLDLGDGVLFNVEFTDFQTAADTYGPYPGNLLLFLDLPGKQEAIGEVVDLINDALNDEGGVLGVGSDELPIGSSTYVVAYDTERENDLETAFVWESEVGLPDFWSRGAARILPYNNDDGNAVWADITPVPEPGTAALLGLGLTGLAVAGRSRRAATRETA